MKKTSITSDESRTEDQESQYFALIKAGVRKGGQLALKKADPDRAGLSRLLERGDEFVDAINETIVDKVRELSMSNQFSAEEVGSNYDYLSGYAKPCEITNQIDILRAHWPNLNPDRALRYMRETHPVLRLPEWIEGPFAIIRPEFFSDKYGEELEEVLRAIAKDRQDRFENYRAGQLGPEFLRQSKRTLSKLRTITEQQSGSDILITYCQFGIRHRGRSVRRSREVFALGEYGVGSKDSGTMLLTNPNRLQDFNDLWLDCPGDEFAPEAVGRFVGAPGFFFSDERVRFGARRVDDVRDDCGSVSGFLPQPV